MKYRSYLDAAGTRARMAQLRNLLNQPLQFFIGEDEWDAPKGWYMRSLNIGYDLPASPQPNSSVGQTTRRGGINWITATVAFDLLGDNPTVVAG